MTFEVKYYSPDGRVGDWNTEQFSCPLIEDVSDDNVIGDVKGQKYISPVLAETASIRSL